VSGPVGIDELPGWLQSLAQAAERIEARQLSPFLPPADGSARLSAVLLLFGEGIAGPDVLLIERSHNMRSHAGQMAFPGGALDGDDAGPVAAAMREAAEETGLQEGGVDIFATLPALWVPPSNFAVTPVLAWWREPCTVRVLDPGEVASVHRVPLARLLDPAHRFSVRHPSGSVGPAFDLDGLLVWGFTAGLLSRLFQLAGWERPWDTTRVEELPPQVLELASRTPRRTDHLTGGGS
jgi:8-oxo-dGTP pyrophosphatase MutT (NUDIX family)